MKTANQYIADARRGGNNRHLNFVDSSRSFVNQPNMYNATGAQAAAPSGNVKKSLPYAIVVSSASAAAVANFDVLGASTYLNNSGFDASGNLVIGSITISSSIPNVTYRDFLYQCMNQPFTVGSTYFSCSTAGQVTEIVNVTTKDSNGTLVTVPITPFIDPYQQQSTVVVVDTEYRIDGFTKLTFSQILANAVLTIRFYPSDNVNSARLLAGQGVTKQYGDPNLIR